MSKDFLICVLVSLVLALYTNETAAQAGYTVYYGLMHSHTSYSDGSGTPEDAFKAAKAGGLDFFAVTEHNHDKADGKDALKDGVLIANNHDLYSGTSPIQVNGKNAKSLQVAAREATSARFLALYGQEFSTISSGNHLCVFNAPKVLTMSNGDFTAFYSYLRRQDNPNIIVQFNHPDVRNDLLYKGSKKDILAKMRNDYGYDEPELGANFEEFVDHTDKYVQLIELITGPALKDTIYGPGYRYAGSHLKEADYFYYLTQGFHLSPSAGQDNHYKNWGVSTGARVGVFATALTNEAVCEAVRNYRTFATEDENLQVSFIANGKFMGSVLQAEEGGALKLKVKISDGDEPNAEYSIAVCGGPIDPQEYGQEYATPIETLAEPSLIGDGTVDIALVALGAAEFLYVKVKQKDGGRAWSAPVWINHKENGNPPAPLEIEEE